MRRRGEVQGVVTAHVWHVGGNGVNGIIIGVIT